MLPHELSVLRILSNVAFDMFQLSTLRDKVSEVETRMDNLENKLEDISGSKKKGNPGNISEP